MSKEKTQKKTKTAQPAGGLKAVVYDVKGKEAGTVKLPARVFGAAWNPDLVHQVVVAQQSNKRSGTAHTKGRGEVRGGGKKPWRQKGTGRARHGSRRSPIWKGGGVTHGPTKDKNYEKKVNKKMRVAALYSALSRKYKDGEIMFVDALDFAKPKTKQAQDILNKLGGIKGFEGVAAKKKNGALVTVFGNDMNVKKSFANIPGVAVDETRNLNPLAVLTNTYIIIANPKESVAFLESRGTK